ncbi:MAG: hydrogenase maturation protease [Actinomycetota bacterium]|nr:hydrogenase maturation protease [Actinomycetota bacterium]
MTSDGEGTVVLALGNILTGDDGAGPAALAELLRTHELPPHVEVLDGGVLGMNLLGLLAGARALLVLDAVETRRRPGELIRLEGTDLRAAFAARLSTHELGFVELLAATRLQGREPPRLVLWGVQPGEVSPMMGLSSPVAAAVPRLAEAAAGELREWGLTVTGRASPAPPPTYPDGILSLTATRRLVTENR